MTERTDSSSRNAIAVGVAILLVVAAVIRELRTPASERHWVGKVAGFVPYDFRRPNLQRLVASIWAPDDSRILKPYAFGVGWTINFGRLARIAQRRRDNQRSIRDVA